MTPSECQTAVRKVVCGVWSFRPRPPLLPCRGAEAAGVNLSVRTKMPNFLWLLLLPLPVSEVMESHWLWWGGRTAQQRTSPGGSLAEAFPQPACRQQQRLAEVCTSHLSENAVSLVSLHHCPASLCTQAQLVHPAFWISMTEPEQPLNY